MKVFRAIGKVFLVLVFVVCATNIVYGENLSRQDQENTYKNLELFAQALAKVQLNYVDKKEPKDLIYGSLEGLLASLDPYSQFLTKEDYQDLLSDTEGKFGGLGVEISVKDGLLTVISPLEGTPAWDAGIKSGDRIVKIEDTVTRGITIFDAVKQLRGDPGTKVRLTILREKDGLIKELEITRAIIKVQDIRDVDILRDNIAYLKIGEFRENTAKELDGQLNRLFKQGMKALILDLRNNPGGLLSSAVEVASRFVSDDKLIVYTLDRDENKNEYKAVSNITRYTDIPMVVLANEGSASGSEIVAGCLQDYKRAVILGNKTFGKASVQTLIPLSDGSALRLTTAKYYTPNGRLIHEEGIYPDIQVDYQEIKENKTKEDEIFDKLEKKEKQETQDQQESVDERDIKETYIHDNQILRALDLLKALMIVKT